MATTLQARIAPRGRTGGEKSKQRDGHRAEQAVARAGHGLGDKKSKASAGSRAAVVTRVTAAALCIRAAGREGA